MLTAFVNGRILTPDGVVSGKTVVVDDGRIQTIAADAPGNAPAYDLQGELLLPGFVDLQVNGGGGVLFNTEPSVDGLRRIGAAHARFGTTGFLPTLVSSDLDTIETAISAVDAAIAAGVPGVLGIHIEGPFISPKRRGIHDAGNFLKPGDRALRLLTSLKRGRTLVTLAPEVCDAAFIAALAKAGVIVSIGHSDATYDEAQAALKDGVKGFTHLFNAMSPLMNRLPGVVGAALDSDAPCGLIADGHHVHPALLRVALACKGVGRLMLVTDAMPPTGSAEKTYTMQGKTITARDGVCTGPDGTLAGADAGMADIVRSARNFLHADLPALSRMASTNAAEFLGLEPARIVPGGRADLALVDDDFRVRQTWIGGTPQLP